MKLELCEPQLSYPTGANHIVGFMDLQARRRWTAPGEPRSRRTSVPSPEPVPPPKEWKTKNPPRFGSTEGSNGEKRNGRLMVKIVISLWKMVIYMVNIQKAIENGHL